MRAGFGKYTYPNGDVYEGDWAGNVRDGQGTYTYAATGAKVRVCRGLAAGGLPCVGERR